MQQILFYDEDMFICFRHERVVKHLQFMMFFRKFKKMVLKYEKMLYRLSVWQQNILKDM